MGEYRELVGPGFIDVADRSVGDDTGHAADFSAEREQSAPAARFEARALFDDDHVVRSRGFDRRNAQVPGRAGGRITHIEQHRYNLACDPAGAGLLNQSGSNSLEAQPIEGIGHRTAIEVAQSADRVGGKYFARGFHGFLSAERPAR